MRTTQWSLFVIGFIFSGIVFAGEVASEQKLKPEDVCKSIPSDKYEAQCNTAVKDGYFDPKATKVCYEQKTDYDKKSCMEVIRGKDYTENQLKNCVNGKKVRLTMCLKLNGELRKENAPSDEAETPIDN